MRKEKQAMRLQFAREIEAAQAQLGEKESQLGYQHLETLQKLKEDSKKGFLPFFLTKIMVLNFFFSSA